MPTPQIKAQRLIGGLNGSEMMILRGAMFSVVYDLKQKEAIEINDISLAAQLECLFDGVDTNSAMACVRMCIRGNDDPVKEVVRRYCDSIPEKHSGGWLYRGSSHGKDAYALKIPDAFDLVEEWCDGGLRLVWKSDLEMAIVTYCEGDVTVEVYLDDTAYQLAVQSAKEFYAKH